MLSAVLDVALGVIMLFLVLSAAASALSETLSSLLKWRSNDLKKFLEQAMADPNLIQTFVTPFIQGKEHPDYIATEDFVRHVVGAMTQNVNTVTATFPSTSSSTVLDPAQLQAYVNTLPAGSLKSVLTSIINTGQTDVKHIQNELTKWYDNSMSTLSSWYKKRLNYVLLIIGFAAAIGFNIDAIAYANRLFESPATRAAIAAQASPTLQLVGPATTNSVAPAQATALSPSQLQTELQMLDMPIGWTSASMSTLPDISKDFGGWFSWWLLKILGLAITAFAVSQGAPFWFDLLNRITNLRSGSKPESPTELAAAVATSSGPTSVAVNNPAPSVVEVTTPTPPTDPNTAPPPSTTSTAPTDPNTAPPSAPSTTDSAPTPPIDPSTAKG